MDINREYILCAAIHVNDGNHYNDQPVDIVEGFVVTGRRHSDCYQVIESMCKILNRDDKVNSIRNIATRHYQGFITSKNRYVNRELAFKIAKDQNQIYHDFHNKDNKGFLISEDLYPD